MPSLRRYAKTFRAITEKYVQEDGTSTIKRPELTADDQVNAWVDQTGHVIVQVAPTMTVKVERDGKSIVRKTVHAITVVFMSEEDYYYAETRIRRAALVGEGQYDRQPEPEEQTPQPEEVGGPEGFVMPAVGDDEDA